MRILTSATEKLFRPLTFLPCNRIEISLDKEAKKFIFTFFSLDDTGHRELARGSAVYKFIQRLPEQKCLQSASYDSYTVGLTDTSAILVDKLWPKDQVLFASKDAETFYLYLLVTLRTQGNNLDRIARYKADKTQHGFNGYEDNPLLPLTPYQKLATVCSLNSEAFALHMKQGTGKSPIAIAVMCNDAKKLNKSRMYRTLIVCPKNVRANWVDEIERFKTCSGRITVLRGTEFDRIRLLLDAMRQKNGETFSAVIVSYETMARMLDAFRHIEWDLGVLDEHHATASPITKRSKASLILRDFCKRRLGLTGTPIRNCALDLYAQLEFLGQGFSGFSSWKSFKQFYGVYERTNYGEKLIGVQNLPLLQERLARLSFSITKEEALPDLPDKVYDVIEVTMTAKQIAAYEQLSNTLRLKIESDLANASANREMVVQNILTQLLRLAQITSGFMVFSEIQDEGGNIVEPKLIEFFSPNPKLETLIKILKGTEDEDDEFPLKDANDKTIIWACWTADIHTIHGRLITEGIESVTYYGGMSDKDRDEAVKLFNEDPTIKVFIGNAAAGGVGLNLLGYPPGKPEACETNANHVIYYSQNWSQVQRSQSEDRAHRRGTREPVRITDLCVPKSIDEEIRARVLAKKKLAFEVGDIRNILKALYQGTFENEE